MGWSIVTFACVLGALAAVVARLLWGWRTSGLSVGRRVAIGFGVTVLFLALGWIPTLAFHAHTMLFAPLSRFDSAHRLWLRCPMQSGSKWLPASVFQEPSWQMGQCCLINMENGQTVWPSRLISTFYAENGASPDGRRFVIGMSGRWPFSGLWRTLLPRAWRGEAREDVYFWYVFAPETGSLIRLGDIWPEIPTRVEDDKPWFKPCGWVDDRTVALVGNDSFVFINIETREVRESRSPMRLGARRLPLWGGRFTDRGVLVPAPTSVEGNAEPLILLRFTPDLPEAEETRLPVNLASPGIHRASRNGEWAVIDGTTSGKSKQRMLISLRGKAAPLVLESVGQNSALLGAWVFRDAQPILCGLVGREGVVIDLRDMSRRAFEVCKPGVAEGTGGFWQLRFAPAGRRAAIGVVIEPLKNARVVYRIVDFDSARYWDLSFGLNQGELYWLNNESLVARPWNERYYAFSADGAERRPLPYK